MIFSDHLGSGTFIVDHETGELVEYSTYQAYGQTDSDYRPSRWGQFRDAYKFGGKEEDVEVGLAYFGARYLSLGLNRWMSADPATIHELGSDANPYAYVKGRPLVAVDPDGRWLHILVGAIVGTVVAAVAYTANNGFDPTNGNWLKGFLVATHVGGIVGAAAAATGGAVGGAVGGWFASPIVGAGLGGAAGGAAGSAAGYGASWAVTNGLAEVGVIERGQKWSTGAFLTGMLTGAVVGGLSGLASHGLFGEPEPNLGDTEVENASEGAKKFRQHYRDTMVKPDARGDFREPYTTVWRNGDQRIMRAPEWGPPCSGGNCDPPPLGQGAWAKPPPGDGWKLDASIHGHPKSSEFSGVDVGDDGLIRGDVAAHEDLAKGRPWFKSHLVGKDGSIKSLPGNVTESALHYRTNTVVGASAGGVLGTGTGLLYGWLKEDRF